MHTAEFNGLGRPTVTTLRAAVFRRQYKRNLRKAAPLLYCTRRNTISSHTPGTVDGDNSESRSCSEGTTEEHRQDDAAESHKTGQKYWGWSRFIGKKALISAAVAGGVTVAAPVVLGAVGFASAGVAAGSAAAAWQSSIGNVAAGSLFASLQSIGATGAVPAGVQVAAAAIGLAIPCRSSKSDSKQDQESMGNRPPSSDDDGGEAEE